MLPHGPGRSRFTLALLVGLSVTLIVADLGGLGVVGTVRDGALGVFGPVRSAGDAVFGPIGDVFGRDLEAENEDLRARVEELEGAEARAANAEAELRALRRELGLSSPEQVSAVAARVVGGPRANFDRTIEIDKGADAAIEPGMPVRTGAGLVGVVDRVSFNRATVRLITDPDTRVGVRHIPSLDLAVARGDGEGRPLVVDAAFEAETEVAEGDLFTTAGLDGSTFPGDIPVGTAAQVRPAATPLEQEVLLEPSADLDDMTFVAVLLYQPAGGGGGDG